MTRRGSVVLLVVAAFTVTASACGSSADNAADTTVAGSEVEVSGLVYLRPVLQCAPAPGSATDETSTVATPAGRVGTPTTALAPFPGEPTESAVLYTRPGPDREICQVGPAGGTAAVFSDAEAQVIAAGWGVVATLRPDSSGEGVWNALAESCYSATSECPTRRLAIEVDGVIVSAPTVNAPSFTGSVQITGTFSEAEAKDLATVIARGADDS